MKHPLSVYLLIHKYCYVATCLSLSVVVILQLSISPSIRHESCSERSFNSCCRPVVTADREGSVISVRRSRAANKENNSSSWSKPEKEYYTVAENIYYPYIYVISRSQITIICIIMLLKSAKPFYIVYNSVQLWSTSGKRSHK